MDNASAIPKTLPEIPYKGLEHYQEADAPFFFGRQREWQVVADNLIASRLTVLYGVSGVGKSSLLRAGVAHYLQQQARRNLADSGVPEFAVVVFNAWQDDPLADFLQQVAAAVTALLPDESPPASVATRGLPPILKDWAQRLNPGPGGQLFVILDQFEEYFLYHTQEEDPGPFARELLRVLNHPDSPVNVLISIREDSLARLDQFKAQVPNLFDNLVSVKHLNAKAAYDAVVKPIQVYNQGLAPYEEPITVDEGLVKVVVDQVSQIIRQSNGQGILKKSRLESEKYIEAPYLQLVMEYLWKEEINHRHSDCLRLKTLLDIGGAEQIVKAHLGRQMTLLRQQEGEQAVKVAAKVFQYLVTPSGSKIAYPFQDLVESTGLPEQQLKQLLEKLAGGNLRLLRPVKKSSRDDLDRYEIFHDVLAHPILEWRKAFFLDEAIQQGIPAQALRELRLKRHESAALLARQAYCFYRRERNPYLHQIDDALREILAAPDFSNTLQGNASGLKGGISAVAFNPRYPHMLVAANYQGVIQLWDLRRRPNGHCPRILDHQDSAIYTLAISADGQQLASGNEQGAVKLWWNLPQASPACRLLGRHSQRVAAVAFNCQGTLLASGSNDRTVKLWPLDPSGETAPVTLTGHTEAIKAVAFNPHPQNSQLLASGGKDKTIRVWDCQQPQRSPLVLTGHGDIVRSLCFSPDGHTLASGGADQTVRLWHLRDLEPSGVTSCVLGQHQNRVRAVAFSPDGGLLASGGADQRVQLWRLSPSESLPTLAAPPRVLKGHDYGINTLAFSGDDPRPLLASGGWDNTVRLWHLSPAPAKPRTLNTHGDNVMAVAVSADGRWLAAAGWDRTVRLLDLQQSEAQPQVIGVHNGGVYDLAFDPGGGQLASASQDGTIKLWRDFQRRDQPPEVLRGCGDGVSALAFGPGGRWLVSGSWAQDPTVRLWDLQGEPGSLTSRVLWRHGGSVTSVAFDGTGRWLASASDDATVKVIDLGAIAGDRWGAIATGERAPLTLTGHRARVWSVALDGAGRYLASGGDDRTVRVWRLDALEAEPQVIEGHNFWVGGVSFSPDGRTLAAAGYDKTIRLWDVNHLDESSRILRGHEQSVTSVVFTPDGQRLISGSYDNTVRSWIVDTEVLADMVCGRVLGNLTRRQWRQFMGPDIPYEATCEVFAPGAMVVAEDGAERLLGELELEFRGKLAQLFPGQRFFLRFVEQRAARGLDTAEVDLTQSLHKPRGDEGTYFRLETLRLLGFLQVTQPGREPGTIRYGLSPRYGEFLAGRRDQG